ncbi:hypothetical protein GCM10010442_39210 [Kitasatospora kifunensis]
MDRNVSSRRERFDIPAIEAIPHCAKVHKAPQCYLKPYGVETRNFAASGRGGEAGEQHQGEVPRVALDVRASRPAELSAGP